MGPWRLVYGRRKTGKSFFVREFTGWERYFFTLPNGTLREISSGEEYDYETFRRLLPYILEESIVVDEFQRLPATFVHELHALGRQGMLTLITSSKFYAEALLGRGSPLLGLVTPFPMGIIDPRDIVLAVDDLELAVFLREPWLIGQMESVEDLPELIPVVPALLGEVFKEEDRRLTETYEAILLGISSGAQTSGALKSFLSGKIGRNASVSSFLRILEGVGLVKKIIVWGGGKARYIFRHASPMTDIYYYLMRYGFPEIPLAPRLLAEKIRQRLPIYVEDFVREFFSRVFGYPEGVYIKKMGDQILELDIVLGTRKPKIVAEVKWTDRLNRGEVQRIERLLSRFRDARKILFVKDKGAVPPTKLELMDPEDLRRIARETLPKETRP